KSIVAISIVLFFGAALVLSFRNRNRKQRLDEIYAELKALPPVARDFNTPEGAILCLEDDYRHHDIEAAIAAKDFKTEARLMLEKTVRKDIIDDALISKTAEALTLSFRFYTTNKWPDFDGLESFFTKREPYSDKVVIVTEVCRFPDREFSTQRLLVSQTDNGWRVLNPESKSK